MQTMRGLGLVKIMRTARYAFLPLLALAASPQAMAAVTLASQGAVATAAAAAASAAPTPAKVMTLSDLRKK